MPGRADLSVSATEFRREMASGRTRPCVFSCEMPDGSAAGEFVVKLRSRMDMGNQSATNELIASMLAIELGLEVPEPAVVEIAPELADAIIQLDLRTDVRASAGLNFGSRLLGAGWRAWQRGETLHRNRIDSGFEIFTFDAFIDNPDRSGKQVRSTNLMTDGSRIVALDHELAFSFLHALTTSLDPWTLPDSAFLREHVFYDQLKSMLVSADRIRAAIAALSPERLDAVESAIPNEWRSPHLSSIRARIDAIVGNADGFITAVKELLR